MAAKPTKYVEDRFYDLQNPKILDTEQQRLGGSA